MRAPPLRSPHGELASSQKCQHRARLRGVRIPVERDGGDARRPGVEEGSEQGLGAGPMTIVSGGETRKKCGVCPRLFVDQTRSKVRKYCSPACSKIAKEETTRRWFAKQPRGWRREWNREYQRKWRDENREVVRLYMREYARTWREKNRAKLRLRYRSDHEAARDRDLAKIREQGNARSRKYFKTPKGRLTSRASALRRRGRLGDVRLTTADLRFRMALFGGKCAYCDRYRKLTVDHVIPVYSGGLSVASNILPACSSCNKQKGRSSWKKWFAAQVFYSRTRAREIAELLR